MPWQNSESELAGRLGASLTARVPRTGAHAADEQDTGLIDIGLLYAATTAEARLVRPVRARAPGDGPEARARRAGVAGRRAGDS